MTCVRVFILPPRAANLERRPARAGRRPPDVVGPPDGRANNEISRWSEYDYVIVNDDIPKAPKTA